MEVHLKPETESRLSELASQSGRPTDELLEDAIAGYLAQVAEVRRSPRPPRGPLQRHQKWARQAHRGRDVLRRLASARREIAQPAPSRMSVPLTEYHANSPQSDPRRLERTNSACIRSGELQPSSVRLATQLVVRVRTDTTANN